MNYRILSTQLAQGGGLIIIAEPYGGPEAPARGFGRYVVPAGPLAGTLALAMEQGEIWRMAIAEDRETVLGAAYEGVGDAQHR